MIHQIRAKAGMEGNLVYSKSSIRPPRKRSPIGKPGAPYKFTFELRQDGYLALSWRCDNPKRATGTIYHVRRQLNGPAVGNGGDFVYLGHVGKKKFVDRTLPAGVASVTYEVQAARSTSSGAAATYQISFGGGRGAVSSATLVARVAA